MEEDFAVRVFKFKEESNVLFLQRWIGSNSKLVDLSVDIKNPFTGEKSKQIFRRVSTLGKRIYYYSEGNAEGEILGG